MTTKPPKPTTLAVVDPPDVNPIPEPKLLVSHFMSTAKTLASAFAAAYDSIKPVQADQEQETARIRGLLQSHGPDWTFSTTGMTYPVSRRLSQLSGQAIYAVGAYVHALTEAERLLNETGPLIELAESFHTKERTKASMLSHLELLEVYFNDFQKLKQERSKLLGLVTTDYLKRLPEALAVRAVTRLLRAVVNVALEHDQGVDQAALTKLQRQVESIRNTPYPMNEEFQRQVELLTPLLGEGETLALPKKIWTESADLFAPSTIK